MSIAACSGFINLDEAHLDKPVYRVLPFDRLLQSLVARELVLSKPKLWDDPFENALLKGAFRTQDGSRYSFVAQNYVYGQCWTLHRETDAMWRIYSAAAKGVRVSSTPRKLLRALQDHDPQFATSHCFIGRVTYQTKAEILRSLGNLRVLADAGPAIAESLLFKRNEFRHEREVRLIYYNSRHVGH